MAVGAHEGVRWTLMTPRPTGREGAVAVIQLAAPSEGAIDGALEAVCGRRVGVGRVVLGDLMGVDKGLVVRTEGSRALLMPHAGPFVIRRLIEELGGIGIVEGRGADPLELFPEAWDQVEACALHAISVARSPRASVAILEEAQRWRRGGVVDEARGAVMDRLIWPATVCAAGPANVGKSTLLNALADRAVAVVADEAGTTRDHVGIEIDLGGVVVRWVDTPGIREGLGEGAAGAVEGDAIELARRLIASADLVVSCGDGVSGFLGAEVVGEGALRCAMRCDRFGAPSGSAVRTAVGDARDRSRGLVALTAAVVDRLLPTRVVEGEGLWRFHPGLPEPGGG